MRKNNLFRWIAGVLCAALICLAFCGCGASGNQDQLDKIKSSGQMVVGVEGTYAPFTYHGDDGELTGFDVELARMLAQKLGVEASFTEAAWDSLLAGMDSGRFDTVINDVSVTEEREEKYDFSTPYLYIPLQMVVKEGSGLVIGSLADVKGLKVATSSTNSLVPTLEENGAEIVAVTTSDEAATLVLSGRADVCLFSPVLLNDYLSQHPDAALEVAYKITETQEVVAIPVVKGQENLLTAVNQALQELSESGELSALSQKYFGGDYTLDGSVTG